MKKATLSDLKSEEDMLYNEKDARQEGQELKPQHHGPHPRPSVAIQEVEGRTKGKAQCQASGSSSERVHHANTELQVCLVGKGHGHHDTHEKHR